MTTHPVCTVRLQNHRWACRVERFYYPLFHRASGPGEATEARFKSMISGLWVRSCSTSQTKAGKVVYVRQTLTVKTVLLLFLTAVSVNVEADCCVGKHTI